MIKEQKLSYNNLKDTNNMEDQIEFREGCVMVHNPASDEKHI
jgi:hypothetical protein